MSDATMEKWLLNDAKSSSAVSAGNSDKVYGILGFQDNKNLIKRNVLIQNYKY